MTTQTTNYKLRKPSEEDFIDINELNYNFDEIDKLLKNRVEKESGKVLSSNDYTNDDKDKVSTIGDKVDKAPGKGLSTNDYTDQDKQKLSTLKNYSHPETHLASMIIFADGETLEEKFNNNTLFTQSV